MMQDPKKKKKTSFSADACIDTIHHAVNRFISSELRKKKKKKGGGLKKGRKLIWHSQR